MNPSNSTRRDFFSVGQEDVHHKGQHFAGLARHWDETLGTARYRSAQGLLPPGARAVLPLLHGSGPMTSHAGSMLALLNILTESKKKKSRSKSLRALQGVPHYSSYGGEAIDLPGSHGMPLPDGLCHLEGIVAWILQWLSALGDEAGVRVIPVARCASATPLVELNCRHSKLLHGMILLSPMLPSEAEHSNGDLMRRVSRGECELNQPAFELMNTLNAQSTWESEPDPFDGTPTLILTGAQDQQTSGHVRGQYVAWSEALPHVTYAEFNTGHDVFNLREGQPSREAYAAMYAFLHKCAPCG